MEITKRGVIVITSIILLLALVAMYFYWSMESKIKIYIATTTSLYETGLLDQLSGKFTEMYPRVEIAFLAVGSGEALERAARGDACIALTHAPTLEAKYIANGTLTGHTIFAYNYFIIVGPREDPAGVASARDAIDAFSRIYEAAEKGLTVFISRGDKSGTNTKEMEIWRKAGLDPQGKDWYKVCGCGMTNALVMASELNGYTLSDISTFLKLKKSGKLDNLEALYQGSVSLINIYSAYLSSKCTGEQLKYSRLFIEFLISKDGQEIIASYGIKEYGVPLFNSVDNKVEELNESWNQLAGGQ